MQNSIVVKDLEKIYGYGRNSLTVLKKISLEINEGEIVSIVGPSGAGKSTLLNMIGCLDSFQSGNVILLGNDISNLNVEDLAGIRNKHIGFIFQLHNLLSEFTAVENVMIPLLINRTGKKNARQKALGLLERFDLLNRADHKPAELSGGECQRIAVARALVGDPDIILADEPTGNLDSINSKVLMDTLLELVHETNNTIIIVTHDKTLAERTNRTITLVDGAIKSDLKNN
ncbi:MAG: ABC transporter ATP-binding protein [Spirochaetes bacterium]|nr:ABC transporter ATP-binding protein [Spirochaetota bacterium]